MIAPSQRAAPNDPRQQPRAAHPQAAAAASPAAPLHTDQVPAAQETFSTKKAASMAQRLIGQYPVVAVCTAAALGAALGWLVKRRH